MNRIKDDGRTREWLDLDGNFLFGKHGGEDVNDVARKDPDYLRWILETVENMRDDDSETIQGALDFAARGKRDR